MPRKKLTVSRKFLPLTDLPNNIPPIIQVGLFCLTSPMPQETQTEKLIRLDRILILSEMIRERWYSKFRFSDRPIASEDKKGYQLKSHLFNKTLDLIQEVHLFDPTGYTSPISWFVSVINELEIYALSFVRCGSDQMDADEIETKTQMRKLLQWQNCQIKAYENPFLVKYCRHTYELLERARIFAQTLDKFRENYYTPFRQAREALTTHLLAEALLHRKHGEGFRPTRQGRS
jgi:hypothetical protein